MHEITEHPGVVTLDGDPIEVIVGLDPRHISLASNGSEIGSWSTDECAIVETGTGSYLIIAENEELPFTPTSADLFATALASTSRSSPDEPVEAERASRVSDVIEAPPRPLTQIGFYLLAGVTTLLGAWALWSIIA